MSNSCGTLWIKPRRRSEMGCSGRNGTYMEITHEANDHNFDPLGGPHRVDSWLASSHSHRHRRRELLRVRVRDRRAPTALLAPRHPIHGRQNWVPPPMGRPTVFPPPRDAGPKDSRRLVVRERLTCQPRDVMQCLHHLKATPIMSSYSREVTIDVMDYSSTSCIHGRTFGTPHSEGDGDLHLMDM